MIRALNCMKQRRQDKGDGKHWDLLGTCCSLGTVFSVSSSEARCSTGFERQRDLPMVILLLSVKVRI